LRTHRLTVTRMPSRFGSHWQPSACRWEPIFVSERAP